MVLEDGLDYAGVGGLMSTAMKYRGLAGAVVDGGIRDTPQVYETSVPYLQPRRRSFYDSQSLQSGRHQYPGKVRGSGSQAGRHHHRRC